MTAENQLRVTDQLDPHLPPASMETLQGTPGENDLDKGTPRRPDNGYQLFR